LYSVSIYPDTLYLTDGSSIVCTVESLNLNTVYVKIQNNKYIFNKSAIDKICMSSDSEKIENSISIIKNDGVHITGNLISLSKDRVLISKNTDKKLINIHSSEIQNYSMNLSINSSLYKNFIYEKNSSYIILFEKIKSNIKFSGDTRAFNIYSEDFYDYFWENLSPFFTKLQNEIIWDLMDFYYERERIVSTVNSFKADNQKSIFTKRCDFLVRVNTILNRI